MASMCYNERKKLEFIKNPVIAEFLGMASNTDFTESDLENSILSNLQKFLMELGKGYAFVARQQHIHTEKQDYYIDLVFYNYILKCFVLIDLKTQKITHQDVGQMDMYIWKGYYQVGTPCPNHFWFKTNKTPCYAGVFPVSFRFK